MTVAPQTAVGSPAGPPQRSPRRRRLLIAAIVLGVLGLAAVMDWPHQANTAGLRMDYTLFARKVHADIGSCAVGVRDTLSAYNQIQAGASTDRQTAVRIAKQAALDCTPAGNSQILDLSNLPAPRSLAGHPAGQAPPELIQWAYPTAVAACQDAAAALQGDRSVVPDLRNRLAELQRRGTAAQTALDTTARAVGATPISLGLQGIEPSALLG